MSVREDAARSSATDQQPIGDMAALIRDHDWASSPIGAPNGWPQPLKTLVGVMLAANQPMFIVWGPERTLLYNARYAEILAWKHPGALGCDFLDVWAEIRPDLASIVSQAYAGHAVQMDDIMLMMQRRGFEEEAHFAFSYTPVRDESGGVAGFFCPCTETTREILSERRLAAETERQRRLFEQAPGFISILSGPEHIFEFANATFRRLFGERDYVGKTAREAFPELTDQDFFALLDRVYGSGERFAANAVPIALTTSGGGTDTQFLDFIYEPVVDESGRVTGIFVEGHDVTDTWRAEAALRDSEDRLRRSLELAERKAAELEAVLESMPDAVYIGTVAGITLANRPALDQLGFSSSEELNRDIATLAAEIQTRDAHTGAPIPPEEQAFARAFRGERAVQDVRVRHRLTGEERILRCAAAPVEIEGEVIAAVAVNTDVTDQRRAEERLRLNEEQLRLATEAGGIGPWDYDPLNETLIWPARVKAMFGISPDAAVTIGDFFEGVHPDDRARTKAAFEATQDPDQRAPYDVEYRTIGKEDGLIRWVAARGRGLFNEDQICARVIGTAIDITERKADEVRLRELNEDLEHRVAEQTAARNRVWEMSRELLAIVGFDGSLKVINPAWESTLGEDRDAIRALPLSERTHPEDQADFTSMIAQLVRGEPVDRFENRLRHADGGWRWISWTFVPEGPVFYAVGRDVTREKQSAAELEHMQEALRQSQKMEAMGQLTGGVAHDFNNLLTPIVGGLDMLQREGYGGAREQRLIEGAAKSADRARILVQRLLAFARRQPLQPTAIDVAKLVTGIAELVAKGSGPQIRMVVEAAADLPPAQADLNQLEMALLNLGVNARDAMPDGGTIRISADVEQIIPGHRSSLVPGPYIHLTVSDTGIGMNEVTRSRAIEPFFSTKGVGKGTGLGLSMVHGLASQLGGALTIASSLGIGTEIELWLPISDAAPQGVDHGAPVSPAFAAKGTALLVDDEELVRMSTADMLSDLGYTVIEAESAEQALKLLDDGVNPDLVVTDHLMPGMNGTELAQAIRAERSEVAILIVSGYAENEGVAADIPRLTKPFRRDDLAAKLIEIAGSNGSRAGGTTHLHRAS